MARPLRIEFDGAVYHVMARGNGGDAIFRDDHDRDELLRVLGQVCRDFEWRVLCYCLMENHIHLVITTKRATLSRGMRQLLGVYSQGFNRRYDRQGHVFQGRYKALLVETSAYLTQLCAYVLRNPVAAGLVSGAKQWPWSSYLLNSGKKKLAWFDPKPLWKELGVDSATAPRSLAALLRKDQPSLEPRGQLCYGGDAFAAKIAKKVTALSAEHPRRTRAALSPSIAWYDEKSSSRTEAMVRACVEGHHSASDVARYHGVYPSSVSRAVARSGAKRKT